MTYHIVTTRWRLRAVNRRLGKGHHMSDVIRNGRRYAAILGAVFGAILTGCGGGSVPGTDLAGLVTDVDGKPVAGARVTTSTQSTTSMTNGSFTLTGLPQGNRMVSASISIQGRTWNGETMVDIAGGEKNRSVNIVISDARYQARLRGYVVGPGGFGLEGAKVFIGGPWGSTLAVSGSDGAYEARRLTPGVTYTVTCSLAGYLNDTRTVHLAANDVRDLTFALTHGSASGPIPAPEDPAAQAWTIADAITRSPGNDQGYLEWLKRQYRKRRGLPAAPTRSKIAPTHGSRATPVGSLIEVDLFWDYREWEDLLGYAIKRGTSNPPSFTTAVLRDPLAASFFDMDSTLTPDVVYYYTIHSLDTITFPMNGTLGPASEVVLAQPLGPIQATAPARDDLVVGDPRFMWTGVTGAKHYQVIVWDRFPDLQNSDDPAGAAPIWPYDLGNPGDSRVTAPQTSLRYNGPYLQPGKTYYWLVVASDDGEYAVSVSHLMKFNAR